MLTRAGVGPDIGKAHVGMAPIADERLGQLAEVVLAAKVTPAAARTALKTASLASYRALLDGAR